MEVKNKDGRPQIIGRKVKEKKKILVKIKFKIIKYEKLLSS
jgi:hypothetical protein